MSKQLIIFFLLSISLCSYSQRLLKDIASSDASSYINGDVFNWRNYAIKGDSLFFLAQDTAMTNYYHKNIWFTDGSSTNTKRVTSENRINQTLSYEMLASFKGKVYYRDYTNANLYATDGNDITIVKTFTNSTILKAGIIDEWLYLFISNYSTNTLELWRTNGSSSNTNKVTNIYTGNHYFYNYNFFNSDSEIYFNISTNSYGSEPWITDGTASGTKILKDIVVGSTGSNSNLFGKVGTNIFFAAYDIDSKSKLWKTDGTEAGTVMVANELDGSDNYISGKRISFDNNLYFTTRTNKLYKTDGNNITLVYSNLSIYGEIVKINNLIYFIRQNGNDFELWKSDGSPAGTEKIMTILTSPFYYNTIVRTLAGQSKLYIQFSYFSNSTFQNITQHWVSDGTAIGTFNVNSLNQNYSTGSLNNQLAVVGDIYYFTAYDPTNGFELWKTDGTSIGTYMVKNINKGIASSNPGQFVALNNEVYFSADDIKYGREIWKTDGTTTNTQLLKDYNAGINPDVNSYSIISGMIDYNNMIIAQISHELVKFDSNTPPTPYYNQGVINPQNPEFIKYNNKVFYKGYDRQYGGYELYVTDGNTANKVKDLSIGFEGADPTNFFIWGGLLYFTTNNNTKIWKTDGTEEGTLLVKEFSNGLIRSKFYDVNGFILFSHEGQTYGHELWKSDGTESGTKLVKDINIGSASASIGNMVVFDNNLFFRAYDGINSHLYKSDGSSANTVLFYNSSSTNTPVVFKNKLFFIMSDYYGAPYYLSSTDGISEPTKLKLLGNNSLQNVGNTRLININNTILVFDIIPDLSTHELWMSDGSTTNTKPVKVIRKKTADNYYMNIEEYFYHNNKLYFAVDDGIHGKELWMWDFNCPESMLISNSINQDSDFIVDKYIVGSNKLNPGVKVNYYANNSIILNPGFETQLGSVFTTSMDGCINVPASSLPNTYVNEPIFRNYNKKEDTKPSIIQFLNAPLNTDLLSAYLSEKNNNNEQNISWIIDESLDKNILKMRVNGKEFIGYLSK